MGKFVRSCAVLALFAICAAANTAQSPVASPPPAGILIRHGNVVDGTGSEARRADVRIAGDTIVELGPDLASRPGERVIEATGLIVAPGFIDMHSHADRGLEQMPDAAT